MRVSASVAGDLRSTVSAGSETRTGARRGRTRRRFTLADRPDYVSSGPANFYAPLTLFRDVLPLRRPNLLLPRCLAPFSPGLEWGSMAARKGLGRGSFRSPRCSFRTSGGACMAEVLSLFLSTRPNRNRSRCRYTAADNGLRQICACSTRAQSMLTWGSMGARSCSLDARCCLGGART